MIYMTPLGRTYQYTRSLKYTRNQKTAGVKYGNLRGHGNSLSSRLFKPSNNLYEACRYQRTDANVLFSAVVVMRNSYNYDKRFAGVLFLICVAFLRLMYVSAIYHVILSYFFLNLKKIPRPTDASPTNYFYIVYFYGFYDFLKFWIFFSQGI